MKTLIIVSHPQLAASPTQQFLKASAAGVKGATWHYLDAIKTLDVPAEQALIQAADRLIFEFPLYWYQAPASLHEWLAAVWTRGFAYAEAGGKLTGKTLGLVVSYSQPQQAYQIGGSEGVAMSTLLSPYQALAHKTGLQLLAPLEIAQFSYLTEQQRAELMTRYQQYLTLERPTRFADQAAWFLAQLDQKGTQDEHVALMATTLAARQEQLAGLRHTIAELREGEDD
ncbi:NAD(P)H-dependent oxidoreductase [Lacticaseibacillus camelliae]|uniref:NAD(P)H oxidoreductase n=1 Tax=Lacticaseibacillus camelliae DSM 22697 = JCM 13995 TaxID=1423730 RepID=A0A0R2EYT5_9LACO|nr:NAD(P)H-dependent oxidoreductase [Lacticaseibacillus camelliae]KRN21505.1 NAD(P)H oxidoreductase [Lacticaseibacillus camelliae DSM 22697 = JCM 13995]